MIDLLRYLSVVRQSDQDITRAADGAFKRLMELIRAGQTPQKAISQALREFNADTLVGLEKALSEVLESSLGEQAIRDWKVGDVKLSDRLYDNAKQVSATTKAIITDHMKGVHRAEELRKALYEGYDFQVDPLNVNAPLPKYLQAEFDKFKAATLKTPALRAAYLEAIRVKEAGAGTEALEKKLRIAFYERNRYFANRIARTELHHTYTDQQARDLMSQDRIEYVQVRLSSKHPKTDICDYHTKADLYGLGPGIYPKASAPLPPYHPHCYCLMSPVINLVNPKPKFNPKAERTFLQTLPAKEAAQVAGSFEKRRRVLEDNETLEGIYNQGKNELYQWRRVGDLAQTAVMDTKTIKQFLESDQPGSIPVAVLPADIRERLGAHTDQILLSRYTADKQRKHPEITAESYDWLQDLIDQGERIFNKSLHTVIIQHRGEWFVAVLKTTKARDEVYLQSFRRSDAKDIAKLRGAEKK